MSVLSIHVNTTANLDLAAFVEAAQLLLDNYPAVLQSKAVVEMIFAADVDAIADNRRGRISLKPSLIFPHQRTVVGIQTINGVIEIPNHQPIAGDARR